MAFVDSYSFSHRFTAENPAIDEAGYQEIIHQCNSVNAIGLARQFYQFALGCGYAPQSMVDAFYAVAEEYDKGHCGAEASGHISLKGLQWRKANEQC